MGVVEDAESLNLEKVILLECLSYVFLEQHVVLHSYSMLKVVGVLVHTIVSCSRHATTDCKNSDPNLPSSALRQID